MTLLEAIANYLVDLGLAVGLGKDVYVDFTPEAPSEVVVLTEYQGDPASPFISCVHRAVQIKVRSVSATTARLRAVGLFEALTTQDETRRIDFSSDAWGQVYIRQLPFKVSQDSNDWAAYAFNIGVTTNIIE